MLYGMEDFVRLLHLENHDRNDFFGFSIRVSGVWLPPDTDNKYRLLTSAEIAVIYRGFEHHDFSKPVLAFPCTRSALREFLRKSHLDGMVFKKASEIYTGKPDLTPAQNEAPSEYTKRLLDEIQDPGEIKLNSDDRKAIVLLLR